VSIPPSLERFFADLRAPQIADLSPESVFVLPIGAVEQHGPHLPMSTDAVMAEAFGRDLVATYGDASDLWLLPTMTWSKSNEHAWSPGTLWMSATTMMAVLDDLARCLATTPVTRIVFFNGHGGNSALLQVVSRDVRLKHGLRTFVMHPSLPADHGGSSPAEELRMGIHGGTDETSLMLHLRPELVDMTQARRSVPEHLAGFRHVGFGRPVSFGWTSDDFGSEGVIGDPTGASAERGKDLYESMLGAAGEALAEVARFDPTPPRA
jgi:creatinine amidohydrolase